MSKKKKINETTYVNEGGGKGERGYKRDVKSGCDWLKKGGVKVTSLGSVGCYTKGRG